MDVVIFGVRQLSKLAWYVLTHDSPHRVVGFCLHGAFIRDETFMGLPIVPFESMQERFPPEQVAMLAPMGWKRMNGFRTEVFLEGKSKGYRFASYVSSRALVWPDLTVGENCLIYDGCIVQPFARIGDNCCIRSAAMISHDVSVGDHCFIASNAVVAGSVKLGSSCVVGLNSTIRDDTRVAERCFIGAGAVVVGDTEANGVYMGIPARRQPGTVDDLKGVRE